MTNIVTPITRSHEAEVDHELMKHFANYIHCTKVIEDLIADVTDELELDPATCTQDEFVSTVKERLLVRIEAHPDRVALQSCMAAQHLYESIEKVADQVDAEARQ